MKIATEAPIPDWAALETAFEHNAPDHHAYIDSSNGQVVTINDSRPEDEEKRALISKSTGRFIHLDPASARAVPLDGALRGLRRGPRCAIACWSPSTARAPFVASRTCCSPTRSSASAGPATARTCCTSTSTAGSPARTSPSAPIRRGASPRSRPSPTCRWRSCSASAA